MNKHYNWLAVVKYRISVSAWGHLISFCVWTSGVKNSYVISDDNSLMDKCVKNKYN